MLVNKAKSNGVKYSKEYYSYLEILQQLIIFYYFISQQIDSLYNFRIK